MAGDEQEEPDKILRDAFSILSAAGYLEAAAEIGRIRFEQAPADPVRRYLLDAVTGQPLSAAPNDYVEAYFDHFAPQFDQKLVETLGYAAPEIMLAQILRYRTRFGRMLDAGCGTGLAAERLAALGPDLVGVDLSSGMLDEARKRGRYSTLIKSDIVAFLDTCETRFDLLFAADLLIYFGDLSPFVAAAAKAMEPGGTLALCLEAGGPADYKLLSSGRFQHSSAYVEAVIAAEFILLDFARHDIRLEAGRPVPGFYLLLQRR